MKIAIDLDGTGWKHREFFKEFAWAMVERGHYIGILTAHYHEQFMDRDLDLWKRRGFPPPSFYIARKGEKDHNMLIGEWKREMCAVCSIDFLFEDFGGNNPDIEETFFEEETDTVVFKVIPGEK